MKLKKIKTTLNDEQITCCKTSTKSSFSKTNKKMFKNICVNMIEEKTHLWIVRDSIVSQRHHRIRIAHNSLCKDFVGDKVIRSSDTHIGSLNRMRGCDIHGLNLILGIAINIQFQSQFLWCPACSKRGDIVQRIVFCIHGRFANECLNPTIYSSNLKGNTALIFSPSNPFTEVSRSDAEIDWRKMLKINKMEKLRTWC